MTRLYSMNRKFFFGVETLLCSLSAFSQQQENLGSSIGVNEMFPSSFQSAQEGIRNAPATSTSTRIFTYDAAGNRILMNTPARNAPSYMMENQSMDDQIIVMVTTGMLSVILNEEINEPYSISVYNLAGQLVVDRKNCRGMSQDISLSHLERGVYIIDIFEGNNHNTRKITKE